MTGSICCLCWNISVFIPLPQPGQWPGFPCVPEPNTTSWRKLWLPPGFLQMLSPCPESVGAASTHPSFAAASALVGLALPFVCFSQVSLECVQNSAVCFGRDQTIPNPTSRNTVLIFSSLLTGWWLASGKGIMGKAGMTMGKGGVALLGVCSHLLKFWIKEPEFLEVCEWVGGTEWSGREIVLMYRS